jgi:hypothetical protein
VKTRCQEGFSEVSRRLPQGLLRAWRLRHQAALDRAVADVQSIGLDPTSEREAIELLRGYVETELRQRVAASDSALELRGQRVH